MGANRKFKSKYEELREGISTKQDGPIDSASLAAEDKSYRSVGNIRNLCFAWPDGKKKFFNYAYLVSGELNVSDETNSIVLSFSSHIVTLKGYHLEELFSALVEQSPCLITQTDTRYTSEDENNDTVIEISVSSAN